MAGPAAAGVGGGLCALVVAVAAGLLAFHALTYLLWLYEARVHGRPGPHEPALPWFVAWLGEALALAVAVASWPFGLMPVRRAPRGTTNARPVVLVHDWGLNRASMALLAARLRRDGRDVYPIDYPSTGPDTDAKAAHVAAALRRVADEACATTLDVVAHGQGGVVVRAAARSGNTSALLGNLVTLGAPHGGTPLAAFFRSPRLVQLRPGSHYLDRLREDDSIAESANVATIHSSFDAIVFPDECAYWPGAFSISLDFVGHTGLLLSDRVYTLVKENLGAR
jgi:triacylglycerol lipase